MPDRVIAIGDIHGYSIPLATILAAINPQKSDTIVALGDYVDRGPDSPGAVEMLIELSKKCRLVPLLGNHDEMVLAIHDGAPGLDDWLTFGGRETLDAYACEHPKEIPQSHIRFFRSCVSYYEMKTHIFVHASYVPDLPMDWQPPQILRWATIRRTTPGPHQSGKTVVVGHTAQKDGEILDLGYLKCIDTCCYCGKWLTALEVRTGQVWQAGPDGKLR